MAAAAAVWGASYPWDSEHYIAEEMMYFFVRRYCDGVILFIIR